VSLNFCYLKNDADKEWLNENGSAASEADIHLVLSAINDIQIRGEYIHGYDVGDLDNVVLECS
jgi:hypothetical protein